MARQRLKLDDVDKQIIALLQENPSVSQAAIAKLLGISQPAVGMRIKKLMKAGVLETRVGIPAHRFNLRLAMVGIKTRNPDDLIKKFEKCPRLIFASKAVGSYQLILYFIGSCDRALQNLIETRLSSDPNVLNFDVSLGDTPDSSAFIPLRIPKRLSQISPCGVECSTCPKYVDGRCLGCPASLLRKEKPVEDYIAQLIP